jgi:hypothetical protein
MLRLFSVRQVDVFRIVRRVGPATGFLRTFKCTEKLTAPACLRIDPRL